MALLMLKKNYQPYKVNQKRGQMSWIEQIKVQIPITQTETVNQLLSEIVDNFDKHEEKFRLQICKNAKFPSEIVIYLHWLTEYSGSIGSKEGKSAQQLLARYGMVHHSIWLIIK